MWQERIGRGLVIGVGLVNLAPAVGAASAGTVEGLYDVRVSDPDTALMLRHRAVLLGLVGAGLVTSAFVPRLRSAATVAGLVSMGSYVALHATTDGTNAKAGAVRATDVAALVALGAAAWLGRRVSRR